MTQAFGIAAIGLGAQQQALDVIANNVANLNTPAFRRSDVRFSEIVTRRADEVSLPASLAPGASMAGVRAEAILALDDFGQIERTGDMLDIAIDGPGFIELMGPQGQSLLWRGGALRAREDGLLAGENDLPLRAMISIPLNATQLSIGSDGVVHARVGSEVVELGQIRLVRVDNPAALEGMDGGLYRTADATALIETAPDEDGAGAIVQGALERSNVEINDEMIRLMIVQRAYTANAQIVQAADQLMAIANNLRR